MSSMAAPAAVTSDLIPPSQTGQHPHQHHSQRQHRYLREQEQDRNQDQHQDQNHDQEQKSAPRYSDETREGIASVVSTLRARMAAPSLATPPPSELARRASHTASPSDEPSPAPSHATLPSSTPKPNLTPVSAFPGGGGSTASRPGSSAQSVPHYSQQVFDSPHGHHTAPLVQNQTSQSPHQPAAATIPQDYVPGSGRSNHHSPAMSEQHQGIEASPEYAALGALIKTTDASVVRQVVRDHWQKCLIGSDYHTAFIANSIFHRANPAILARSIQDFGEPMVKAAKLPILKHFGPGDYDEVAEAIYPKLSNIFLDKAMSIRLETIGAQDLVNALARAERLGYDVHDIVQENAGASREHVIPSMHPGPPPPHAQQPNQALPHNTPQYNTHTQGQDGYGAYPPGTKPRDSPPYSTALKSALRLSTKSLTRQLPLATPGGMVFCHNCSRPCSSAVALSYHLKKADCFNPGSLQGELGKDVCVHCGCRFGSSGGLIYHSKSSVCGNYPEKTRLQMIDVVQSYTSQRLHAPNGTPLPPNSIAHHHQQPPRHSVAASPVPILSTPTGRGYTSPVSTPTNGDPYANLTPETRARFEADMKQVQENYSKAMKEAIQLPEPEREVELAKLKNRFNTKQSMTRKKYGIRLRERRSAAEVEEERNRLLGVTPIGNGRPPVKRARVDEGGQAAVTQSTGVADSPRKRVPVSEMGGLSGSSATAELVDPTASLTPSQPRDIGIGQPSSDNAAAAVTAAAPSPRSPPAPLQQTDNAGQQTPPQGTPVDPMQIDDSSNDDNSDGDIPSKTTVPQG